MEVEVLVDETVLVVVEVTVIVLVASPFHGLVTVHTGVCVAFAMCITGVACIVVVVVGPAATGANSTLLRH